MNRRRRRTNEERLLERGTTSVATYKVPQNTGKVRVAVTLGHRFTVWNGRQGKHEFVIPCRNRKQAEEIARKINSHDHTGEVNVD
jgi:hypothetical protein